MKKVLIPVSVLILILAELFFWKGGHHAIYLSGVIDDWLDADDGDQTVTIQLRQPGEKEPSMTLDLDTCWTQYAGQRVFGLTAEGISAYISGQNLYLDTGKTYSLPELPELKQSLRRLSLGLLLYGRVTKNGNTYKIAMKTDELDLTVHVTVDQSVRSVTAKAILPDQTVLHAAVTASEARSHYIPAAVSDAINRAHTEEPTPLTEPLEVLLPVSERLFPLSGDLKLSVSCGILELSETMRLDLLPDKAVLSGKGENLELPLDLSEVPPAAIAVLLLRDGELVRTNDGAQFTMSLPADAATAMLESLVPQAADLGITLDSSTLTLLIAGERPTSGIITAKGSVPFLFTRIPVKFSAQLTITET